MKILLLSDEECPALWDYYVPGRLSEYQLIISCGDLKASYLSFLVTMARCPVLYVHGNHDTHYRDNPPEGCDCIDGHVVEYNGVRILGLGGCWKYHPGDHQYTDRQMRGRILKMRWPMRKAKGIDILVTHAPAEGLGDAEDMAHRGFASLRTFLDKYHPTYHVHGHVHMTYGQNIPRTQDYNGTTIINAYERYTLELPDREVPEKKKNKLIWMNDPPDYV
ncbi:MAG: metallophosphoesterase family protein [Candidatus Faecousia sp.]|nr:metallophosphoesterase family protein [Candidatus Faecousia sp.]